MQFSANFLNRVRDEPISGVIQICDKTLSALSPKYKMGIWSDEERQIIFEAYALTAEIIDAQLLPIEITYPEIGASPNTDCLAIAEWLRSLRNRLSGEASKLKVGALRSKFRASLGVSFAYEFSQGDLDRVQQLINELREHISGATHLEDEHRQRLLNRLEKLQGELHKRVSDLDRFWGLVGDAGVVLGKLGKDAKPIVDRVREIADIVWRTQSRAEELPSGTQLPVLENSPNKDETSKSEPN